MAYTNLDLALGNQGTCTTAFASLPACFLERNLIIHSRSRAVNELLIKDLLIKNDGLGWMIDKYIDDQSESSRGRQELEGPI